MDQCGVVKLNETLQAFVPPSRVKCGLPELPMAHKIIRLPIHIFRPN